MDLKKVFGVPSEARSPEFYRSNLWLGATSAELRWRNWMRVTVLGACLVLVAFLV